MDPLDPNMQGSRSTKMAIIILHNFALSWQKNNLVCCFPHFLKKEKRKKKKQSNLAQLRTDHFSLGVPMDPSTVPMGQRNSRQKKKEKRKTFYSYTHAKNRLTW